MIVHNGVPDHLLTGELPRDSNQQPAGSLKVA